MKRNEGKELRRMIALVLVCAMLMGNAVYASETQNDTIQNENASDLAEETGSVQIEDEQSAAAEDVQSSVAEDEQSAAANESARETEEKAQGTETGEAAEAGQETESGAAAEIGQETESGETAAQEYGAEGYEELTLYIDYPIIEDYYIYGLSEYDCRLVIENEEICSSEVKSNSDSDSVYFLLEGLAEGTTTAVLQRKGKEAAESDYTFWKGYTVTVKTLPDDAVPLKDPVLISALAGNSSNDKNGDGYISFSEMKEINYINLWSYNGYDLWGGVHDLRGLEYATNLEEFSQSGNPELQNIEPLFSLTNLTAAYLDGTKVSLSDRLKLGRVSEENTVLQGESWDTEVSGVLTGVQCSVDEEDSQYLSVVDVWDYTVDSPNLIGLEGGEATLHLSLNGESQDVKFIVEGFKAAQPVGTRNDSVSMSEFTVLHESDGSSALLLDSNGVLWKLGTKVERYAEGDYLCSWSGSEYVVYILDKEHVLWRNGERFAEDIADFDGAYMLTEAGVLTDMETKEALDIEGVADWMQYSEYSYIYVLKTDGTLWKAEKTDEEISEFQKVGDQVSRLYDYMTGYIKDGALYSYESNTPSEEMLGVSNIDWLARDVQLLTTSTRSYNSTDTYYGTDGNVYMWSDEGSQYAKLGEISEIGTIKKFGNDGMFLTEEGVLYQAVWDGAQFSLEKRAENIVYYRYSGEDEAPVSGGVGYAVTADGHYLDENGNLFSVSEGEQKRLWGYWGNYSYGDVRIELYLNADGTTVVKRNDVEILNCVESLFGSSNYVYAIRTDGTIWLLDGVPSQIADLSAEYLRGDVNEDGAVDIKDARITLQGVSERITLSSGQKERADVTGDGNVDVQDLRRILLCVCGKISAL